MEARSVTGNPLQFSQSLYYGTVVLGSEAGTAVKDKTFPSEILRIQAQYPGFPDLNSAVTYRVTNSSEFMMNKDIMLTAVPMEEARTIRVEVEASNTVTKDTATAVVEIQVSERELPSTGEPPGPPKQGSSPSGTGISGDRGKPKFCTCHHQSSPHPQKLEERLGLQVTPLWKPP